MQNGRATFAVRPFMVSGQALAI